MTDSMHSGRHNSEGATPASLDFDVLIESVLEAREAQVGEQDALDLGVVLAWLLTERRAVVLTTDGRPLNLHSGLLHSGLTGLRQQAVERHQRDPAPPAAGLHAAPQLSPAALRRLLLEAASALWEHSACTFALRHELPPGWVVPNPETEAGRLWLRLAETAVDGVYVTIRILEQLERPGPGTGDSAPDPWAGPDSRAGP